MATIVAQRYQLVREIGRGGMGAVWYALDTVLERPVALKQVGLLPGSEVADLERVRREARVSAMLSHPNVVAVFDLADEGERHWLVMEYVEGDTLAELIRREGSLSPDRTAGIVAQAARALGAAHDAGIVHRDVKPSNILVTPDGVAKLGDFGIARTGEDPTLTRTGMVTGSPGYIAPEVATGQTASPASDVWSLGATVYHAVSGTLPYATGENLMGALYRLVHEEPPRTDRAGWLAPMLEATMHRDPAGRWTADQVATFLERGPGAAPAVAPATTQVMPAVPPVPQEAPAPQEPPASGRRRIPWLAAGGALLLVAALVVGLLVWGPDDSPSDAGGPPNESPSSTAPAGPTAAGMTGFVEDYLATVVRDPQAAWERLTPAFQEASGGFEAYSDFWSGIEIATPSDVRADPESLTVSYEVDYQTRSGDSDQDDVTLRLTWDGERYRIDGEPE
jgi:serine/threonine protein kinase